MEDNNQGQYANVDESAQQGFHQLHVKGVGHYQKHVNDDYRHKDVYGGGVAYPPEDRKDNQGYNQYVYDVRERQAQKPENCSRHMFLIK